MQVLRFLHPATRVFLLAALFLPAVLSAQIKVVTNGDVGVGIDPPTAKLDVNGAIRLRAALHDIANNTGNAGQILSSTGTGVQWINPPSGGGGGLPTGTSTQTLRYDASNVLIATSTLTNDGTNIGIGAAPSATHRLFVSGSSITGGTGIFSGTGFGPGSFGAAGIRLLNTTPTTGDQFGLSSENNGSAIFTSGNSGTIFTADANGDLLTNYRLGIGWVGGVTPNTIIGRDATGLVGTVGIGSGLSLTGGTLTATGGGNYTAGTGIDITGNVISNTGDTNAADDITNATAANGDLNGTYPNPTVDGLQNRPVSATAPTNGQVLEWNGTTWAPASDDGTAYTAGTGINITGTVISNTGDTNAADDITNATGAGGDLNGTYPSPTVDGLQNRPVSATAPTNGQVLEWNGTAWAPAADDSGAPAGTSTQTLRYNASNTLVANSVLTNDGSTIGINAAPNSGYDLYINGNMRAEGSGVFRGAGIGPSNSDAANVRLWNTTPTTGDTYDFSSENDGTAQLFSGNSGLIYSVPPGGDFKVNYRLGIGDVTGITPTTIIGRDATGMVGTVGIGSGLSLAGGTLTATGGGNYTAGTGINITGNVISNTGDTNAADDITTATGAGGDLNGTYPNPTVDGLQNRPVSATAPTNGQVLEWNGTAWAPAADDGTNYTAGAGISLAGNVVTNTGVLTTTNAGGDVSGQFSNLQIVANAVGSSEIADGSVTTNEILNGTIAAVDLNSMGATNGQILKWNGTAWAPAADNSGAPAGTSTQTLRYDASNNLVATSTLSNDGTNVAVGSTNLSLARLLVSGVASNVGLKVATGGPLSSGAQAVLIDGSSANTVYGIDDNINTANTLIERIKNLGNNANSASQQQIVVVSNAAGDPTSQFIVENAGSAVTTFTMGVDNSDADKFKIQPATTLGANEIGVTVTTPVTINGQTYSYVGINDATPQVALDVAFSKDGIAFPRGDNNQRPGAGLPIIRYNTEINGFEAKNNIESAVWHRLTCIYNGLNPTFQLFGGASLTGASISVVGDDLKGVITLNTGPSPVANTDIFTMTYVKAFNAQPYVTITPANQLASTDIAKYFVSAYPMNNFTLKSNGTLAPSTQYKFFYQVQN